MSGASSFTERDQERAAHGDLRVLVLAPYPLDRAPSQRFRWEQYIEPLQARGIRLEPSSFLGSEGMEVAHLQGRWAAKAGVIARGLRRRLSDMVAARQYDLVLVHRESLPIGPAWFERTLARLGVPYAFDFDDAIFLPAASEANRRFARLKSPHKTEAAVRGARLVLAGNRYLADWAETYTPRVTVVPTTIDTGVYRAARSSNESPICVGWSGSSTTITHLRLLEPVLREIQRERGVELRVIGDRSYRIAGARVEVLEWKAASEVADLQRIDIGVMPLPDDQWSRGKCGLKALQYMALGIPTILSPVGVNREIARDGAALLADGEDQWVDALRRLIDDPALRSSVGEAGRARVEQDYSVNAMLPTWEHVLREAAKPLGQLHSATIA